MFAIALWDTPRRRLVLARDRMGVKPLYYADTPDGLAFASEVKALLAGGLVRAELDPMAAELFLAHGFVPGPRSLFAGVRKLPPAALLVVEDGQRRRPSAPTGPRGRDGAAAQGSALGGGPGAAARPPARPPCATA